MYVGAGVGSTRFFSNDDWWISDCYLEKKPYVVLLTELTHAVCRQIWILWTNVFCVVHVHCLHQISESSCKTPCPTHLLSATTVVWAHWLVQKHRVFSYGSGFSWTELKLLSRSMQYTAMIRKNFMCKVCLKWNRRVGELLIYCGSEQ